MTMLPRLQAEESLALAGVVGLGTGSLKTGAAVQLRRALERQSGPRRAARADPRALAAMGIAVEVVPPSRGAPEG